MKTNNLNLKQSEFTCESKLVNDLSNLVVEFDSFQIWSKPAYYLLLATLVCAIVKTVSEALGTTQGAKEFQTIVTTGPTEIYSPAEMATSFLFSTLNRPQVIPDDADE